MCTVEERLAQLGHTLPPPPAPVGNYLPATRSGNIMLRAALDWRDARFGGL